MNDDPKPRTGPTVRVITGQIRPPAPAGSAGTSLDAGQVTVSGQLVLADSLAVRSRRADALLQAGDLDGAEAEIAAMARQKPDSPLLRHLQARLLFHRQRWDEAEAAWAELMRLRPDEAAIAHGHAATLARMRRFKQARAELSTVVRRWPDFLLARLNLAGLLRQEFRQPRSALAVLEPALATHDRNPTLHFNRGRAQQDLLDTDGAIASYLRALERDPAHMRAFTAYPFCTHYLPRPDLDALRQWIESHGRQLRRPEALPPRQAATAPGPALRVGLLSGDLCDHPVAYFLESVLTALQRRGVQLFAYATGDKADAVTQRLRRSVTGWHDGAALSERELAQRIADDRLDVLLDLAGFTNHHRLGTLLMRPAPLQLGWLGYFGTQGVPEMDGVIADPHCVPPHERRFFSERLLYLPHTRLCLSPPEGAPEPAPEPPLANASGLRFACLQNLNKINGRVLAAWKRILDGAPGATLLIQGRQLAQPEVRAVFEARLDASGIDRSRVTLGRPCARA